MKSKLNFLIEYPNGEIKDMHEMGLWVSSFHIYSPNAERNIIEKIRMSGAYLGSSRIKTRKIEIGFDIESDSLQDFDELKHDIYRTFYNEGEFKIIRDSSPNKELNAVQEGEYDIENITWSDGEFSLELTMLDPYIYGVEETFTLRDFPIRNEGTVESSPILYAKFIAASSEFIITHENGKLVRVIYNFVANDLLVVDMDKRKVTINNNVKMTALDLSSKWFNLLPGENIITVSAGAVTTIKFRPRWL